MPQQYQHVVPDNTAHLPPGVYKVNPTLEHSTTPPKPVYHDPLEAYDPPKIMVDRN